MKMLVILNISEGGSKYWPLHYKGAPSHSLEDVEASCEAGHQDVEAGDTDPTDLSVNLLKEEVGPYQFLKCLFNVFSYLKNTY